MPETVSTIPNIAQPQLVRRPTTQGAEARAIPILFRHQTRTQWGRAVCLGHQDGRGAFQFEDGKLRLIAKTHMHLLTRVAVPMSEAVSIARDLRSAAGITMARREQKAAGTAPLIDLVQQVALFRDDHPNGFSDEGWLKSVRGREASRHLKRHREHPIVLAGGTLGVAQLESLLETMDGTELLTRIRSVLEQTDLVTKKDLATLEHVTVTEAIAIGSTLHALLKPTSEGDPPLERRMQHYIDTWRRVTGGVPRWQMVTALPALIDPIRFPWVRPSAMREQAKSLAPGLQIAAQPSGHTYAQVCRLAQAVAKRLCEEGLLPQDLMDVTDFIWATLRPAARKRFSKLLATHQRATTEQHDAADAA